MDSSLYQQLFTPILIFVGLLFLRAILSFLETSVTMLRIFKLKEMAQLVPRYQALFVILEKSPQPILVAILIAYSISDVILASLATTITEIPFAYFNLSGGIGFSCGVGLASIAIILFGDIIPKNIARRRGEQLLPSMLWLVNITFYLFYPLVTLLMRLTERMMLTLEGDKALESAEWISSEKEIRFLIDYVHEKGVIELEKTEMLQNIFELGDTPVKDIMVSASDIISVNIDRTAQEVLDVFSRHRFTRLPVYKDRADNIIGMIHQKDVFVLLLKQNIKVLKEIVRPIMFVPETLKVNQLLREFRKQHMHIGMVLNEHGIVTGLITLEDVLEEIVGEIKDEHETTLTKIVPLKDGGFMVEGTVSLDDIEKQIGIQFKQTESVTIGGFLTEQMQRFPQKGDKLAYANHLFVIQKTGNRRIYQVHITRITK